MEADLVKALASLPLDGILIYLIVRQQAQIEKLFNCLVESEREHARTIVSIIASSRFLSNGSGTGEPDKAILRGQE